MYCTVKRKKNEYIKVIFSLLLNFYLVNEIQVLVGESVDSVSALQDWLVLTGECMPL